MLMETVADYGTVYHFGVQTLTTGIFSVWLTGNNAGGAAQIALVVLALVLLLVVLKRVGRRGARFHRLGRSTRPIKRPVLPRAAGLAATVVCLVPFALGFVLPVAVMLGHALRRPEVWLVPGLGRALWNTLTVAGVAAAVTVAAALFLVYGVRLSGRALPRRLMPLAMLGYAAPGAVLALGFLIPLAALDHRVADGVLALTGHDPGLMLTGTAAALVLAYAVRFFAVAQGATDSAFGRVSPSLPMAARSLGRGAGGAVVGLSADDAGIGGGGAAGGVRRLRQGTARDAAVAAVQLQHACHAGVRTGQPRTPVRGGPGGAVGHAVGLVAVLILARATHDRA